MADESTTLALGAALSAVLPAGLTVYLYGDLGAGKTTLVRGLLRHLGHPGKVKSPTYTLVEHYTISGLNLYHFDFYRFNQPEEYLDAGFDEYFQGGCVCLVEWPDKASPYVAAADLRIDLTVDGAGRRVELHPASDKGAACLNTLQPKP